MGGLTLIVFTHRRHATKISGVETSFTPTGAFGVGTNKGAVALAFCIRGVRLCVVNAHLAAHQDKLLQRNQHVQEITKHLRLGTTVLELPLQYHTIWCGDLNYRIDLGQRRAPPPPPCSLAAEDTLRSAVRTFALAVPCLVPAHAEVMLRRRKGSFVGEGHTRPEATRRPAGRVKKRTLAVYARGTA